LGEAAGGDVVKEEALLLERIFYTSWPVKADRPYKAGGPTVYHLEFEGIRDCGTKERNLEMGHVDRRCTGITS
jgi:hypothetical protein